MACNYGRGHVGGGPVDDNRCFDCCRHLVDQHVLQGCREAPGCRGSNKWIYRADLNCGLENLQAFVISPRSCGSAMSSHRSAIWIILLHSATSLVQKDVTDWRLEIAEC